ncbi:MAG: response regulator transcription factor [Dehalococcoidales bacterium]|nr:response regulator transcription factor [Dehalococcoidales bacterium]
MNKTSVLIIDKQVLVRDGLRELLSSEPGLEVSGISPSDDILNVIEDQAPDILLIDIEYPTLSGLELSRKIKHSFPSCRMIIISPNFDNEELFETIKTGAVAYIDQKVSKQELINTIKQACAGEYPINDSLLTKPKVAERVLKQFQDMVGIGKNMDTVTAPLTNKETQVLKQITNGNSNKQIAQLMGTSEQTIKNQISSILRKLNANDRTHAVVLAVKRGLITFDNTPPISK